MKGIYDIMLDRETADGDRSKECLMLARALGCVAWLAGGEVEARNFRPSQIPNGTVNSCSNCHLSSGGGGPRTPFGQAVFTKIGGSSGFVPFWDAALASADSDNDGRTNGQELGDPDGDGFPAPGAVVTHPGDKPPVVTITSPTNGAVLNVPASFTFAATATDPGGSIQGGVQFFRDATLLGTDTSSPFSFAVTNLAAGSYALSAVARDNFNARTTNSISITVGANQPPSVNITNPVDGAIFAAPANFTLGASASDTGGSISQVEFFRGAASLGLDTNAPYSMAVTNLAAGSYTFSAVATDNQSARATNSISVTVNSNQAPTVLLTNPVNNARVPAPATFTLRASATDDAGVTNVQFFQLTTLLGSKSLPPYELTVSNLAAGNYSFAARAVDSFGLASTSAPIAIQILTNATLTSPQFVGSAFQFTVGAIPGQTYVAEFSTNLVNWLPLATNTSETSTLSFTDPNPASSSRLYRVRQDLQ